MHTASPSLEDKVMLVCPGRRGKGYSCAQDSALIQSRGLQQLGEGQETLLGPRSPTNTKQNLVAMGERAGNLPVL